MKTAGFQKCDLHARRVICRGFVRVCVAVLAGVFSLSCHADDLTDATKHRIARIVITVHGDSVSQLSLMLFDTLAVGATAFNEAGEPMHGAVFAWSTTYLGIVDVSASGRVAAKQLGSTAVVATAGDAFAGVPVTVVNQPAAKITLSASALTLRLGDNGQATATVTDSRGRRIPALVKWQSTDQATVSAVGGGMTEDRLTVTTTLQTGRAGSAKIVATQDTARAELTVAVYTPTPKSVTLSKSNITLDYGLSAQFTAVVSDSTPVAISNPPLQWSSTDHNCLPILGGKVEVKQFCATSDTVTIRATSGTVFAEAKVVTRGVPVVEAFPGTASGVAHAPEWPNFLANGRPGYLWYQDYRGPQGEVLPARYNGSIAWGSSDTNVVKHTGALQVTVGAGAGQPYYALALKKPGQAFLRASVLGYSDSVQVTVFDTTKIVVLDAGSYRTVTILVGDTTTLWVAAYNAGGGTVNSSGAITWSRDSTRLVQITKSSARNVSIKALVAGVSHIFAKSDSLNVRYTIYAANPPPPQQTPVYPKPAGPGTTTTGDPGSSSSSCKNGPTSGGYLCLGHVQGVDFYAKEHSYFRGEGLLRIINTTSQKKEVSVAASFTCSDGSTFDGGLQSSTLAAGEVESGEASGWWYMTCNGKHIKLFHLKVWITAA